MKTLHFKDYDEMACAIADKLDEIIQEDAFNDISIIAQYEEARQIIKELICIGYDIKSIDIHDVEWGGYDDAYILSVANIDGVHEVWCEPFLRESGYISDESKVIYIFDNCSSNVISHCNGETMYEISVGDECDCAVKENDKPVSTTSTKEIYKVNGKRVNRDVYEKELAKFEDRYLDNIQDMLLRYCDFMDDWNDLLKMLY